MAPPACPAPVPGVRAEDRVLLVGAYGARNAGDEAILAGMLECLPARNRVTVVSRDPVRTRRTHAVKAVSPVASPAKLRETDVVVIGGGGLFGSNGGPYLHAIPAFGLLASRLGKRVVIHGAGVDCGLPRAKREGLVRLARASAAVTVRDGESASALASFGVPGATVVDDLSVYAQPSPPDQAVALLEIAGIDPSRPVVGLALTAVDPAFDTFLRRDVPALFRAMPCTQFCFVPMSRHPTVRRHNDLALADWLRRRVPGIAVLRSVEHPGDVLALFERFSAAVCMRYHSLLFAARAGTPIVAVPYAPKCVSWLSEHGIAPLEDRPGALTAAVQAALAQPPEGCL